MNSIEESALSDDDLIDVAAAIVAVAMFLILAALGWYAAAMS